MAQDGTSAPRIIGPGVLPPDRFARKDPPLPPTLQERQVEALEKIATSLREIEYGVQRLNQRQSR